MLLDEDRSSQAVSLLEDAIERVGHDPALKLRLRKYLGAAMFYAGQYTRAASVFDAVGRAYREHLPATAPDVLDSSYHAGHAYAQIGKQAKALSHLRFYVQNADAARDEDEAAKILESRFVIAQMLASSGEIEEALSELRGIRPLLADEFGAESTQIRNLDKQISRLKPV
jgi:tetratricopeptide (TPR) repeat protein